MRRFRMKAARFDTADYLCSTLLVWESIPCPIPAAAFSKLNNPLVLIKSHLFWCGVSSTSVCSCELPQPLLHFLISRLTKPIESNFVPFCGGRSYFSAPIQLHTIQPRANRTRSYASRSSELPMVSVFGRDNIELRARPASDDQSVVHADGVVTTTRNPGGALQRFVMPHLLLAIANLDRAD
jgi:hypothetical protein